MNRPNPFAAAAPPRRPIVRRLPPDNAVPRAAGDPEAQSRLSLHWRFRHAEHEVARDGLAQLEEIREATRALERSVSAVVDRAAPQPPILSAAAFSLVADLRQLGDWLFDKQQVDARSVLEKLTRTQNLRFRDAVVKRLADAGLPQAQELVLHATDDAAFQSLLDAPRAPAVYLELQRRGSLLLQAEWFVAHTLGAGGADDWPPRAGSAKASTQARNK